MRALTTTILIAASSCLLAMPGTLSASTASAVARAAAISSTSSIANDAQAFRQVARRAPQAASSGPDALTGALRKAFSRPAPAQEPSAGAVETLAFRRDPAISRRERQRAIDFAGISDADAPATTSAMRSGKLLGEFDKLLRRHGYAPDNLGDALAAYVLLMWEIVAESDSGSSPAGQRAVRRQLIEPLAALPVFTRMDDAQKQERAERTAYRTMLAVYAFQGARARGDRARMAAIKSTVASSMRRSGIDLETLQLTSGGLVSR